MIFINYNPQTAAQLAMRNENNEIHNNNDNKVGHSDSITSAFDLQSIFNKRWTNWRKDLTRWTDTSQ